MFEYRDLVRRLASVEDRTEDDGYVDDETLANILLDFIKEAKSLDAIESAEMRNVVVVVEGGVVQDVRGVDSYEVIDKYDSYYHSFESLLLLEFGIEDDEPQGTDESLYVHGYSNGVRIWDTIDFDLDDDEEFDLAWRLTEDKYDENDFIILRLQNGYYRLATTNEFQKFFGG